MWQWLRLWFEVVLFQGAIFVLCLPVGAVIGGFLTLVIVAVGVVPNDPKGFGVAAVFGLFGLPLGLLTGFVGLWVVAWRRWFRWRMPFRHFLAAWASSLVLVVAAWVAWGILSGYLAASGPVADPAPGGSFPPESAQSDT